MEYKINEETYKALAGYLVTRPYQEVIEIINLLGAVQATAIEPKKDK